VLVSVMLGTGLVALDSTIIATAVPSVVRDLGGFAHYPWLFSIYLLTQAVTVPIYGKLADVIGRKPVILVGICVFIVGSVLCGAAWSMLSLIIFRAVQGIGAGAIQPISMTIIGDIYSVEERARVQGYLAGVWGIASVVGPTLGGVFSEFISWRWIFFVNIPLGLLAFGMLAKRFAERVERREHKVDYLGATLLMIGCSLLILGLLEGGNAWAWGSPQSIAIFAVGVALVVGFVLVERRAEEPVLPLWVFRDRTLVSGVSVSLVVGVVLIGLSSYVPNFAQGVLGASALIAGFVLGAMTLGWPLAASLSGRVYLRIGFRTTMLVGAVVLVVGSIITALLPRDVQLIVIAGACFVIGAGLGLSSSPSVVAVQSAVDWQRRGVATGTVIFFRSVGSAVGAALFGAIANTTLADRFAAAPEQFRGQLSGGADEVDVVLSKPNQPPQLVDYVRSALYDATHRVFIAIAVVAVLGVLAVLIMPRRSVQPKDG
jgi:EmrB/QacA subfamily drug resistance transporter